MSTDFAAECAARAKAYLHKEREEQRAWKAANEKIIRLLKRKLLGIGGKLVSPQIYNLLPIVVACGDRVQHPVVLREMDSCQCHKNVSDLWLNRRPRSRLFAICTGYALVDDDEVWRPHSWALSKTSGKISIVETTVVRSQYFGVILTDEVADMFAKSEAP